MLRLASLVRSAIKRRSPMTLISVVSAASDTAWRGAVFAKSVRKIRPPGPEPATVVRSMPASLARRRLAGEGMNRPGRATGGGAAGGAGVGAEVGAIGLAGVGVGAAGLTDGAVVGAEAM